MLDMVSVLLGINTRGLFHPFERTACRFSTQPPNLEFVFQVKVLSTQFSFILASQTIERNSRLMKRNSGLTIIVSSGLKIRKQNSGLYNNKKLRAGKQASPVALLTQLKPSRTMAKNHGQGTKKITITSESCFTPDPWEIMFLQGTLKTIQVALSQTPHPISVMGHSNT